PAGRRRGGARPGGPTAEGASCSYTLPETRRNVAARTSIIIPDDELLPDGVPGGGRAPVRVRLARGDAGAGSPGLRALPRQGGRRSRGSGPPGDVPGGRVGG